ncbi:3-keto-5-aminohexanoate cleavage protein [Hyphococcus luteus]|uniref:NADPH:quinone reductase n=1 Tax=Hyphococcus luteus TaxID=2058213 RepID=A0A2S7K279_9PROT|nr:3-keto-5-aminohexanoate cleavage protein [Marinicaulis flavus]PQA86548.1 NADPH:quinone reductase [Marinicaulis flavus]
MKRKIVLTCAVTGNAPLNPKYPYEYPVTPKQICEAVAEAASAGASIAHIHVRDPESGSGSRDVALFKEVVDRIRQRGINIVINLTAGMGALFLPDPKDEGRALPESDLIGAEERVEHLVECLPEIASLDVTTGNQMEGDFEFVYLNTTRTLREMAKRFQALGVKPELEAFQAGDVLFANQLVKEGLIDGPSLYQFVLGVKWGAPADPETVLYMRNLLPRDAIWGAMGIAQLQFPMAAQSLLAGGNVRVGLEDNLYLERGVFATNGQLVERAAGLIDSLGCDVASPAEAREMLDLKTPG